ncbi:hypothetical protein TNIN_309561 [Trichonephila inaurata madagascariensis]|uniref:Uncharacterized protein n=1 Tax=Trichonephila inaurata madagascariensis TaxID=2747483 RepID=A0A8X6XG37_9ARAC|nr:hypothetical protein TNIN_309561 [Trichonephila inaurata madagascariensis]
MADKIFDMTHRTEIFATGRSSDCGEATSSNDQLLLDRILSLEEQICQLSILHKSRTKERNSFRPKSRSRSRKRFDPKGKYCYFHFRFGARCAEPSNLFQSRLRCKRRLWTNLLPHSAKNVSLNLWAEFLSPDEDLPSICSSRIP